MATFIKPYKLTLRHCVAVEADNEKEARAIFDRLEGKDVWFYYAKYEIFDHMLDDVVENQRDYVWDVVPEDDVCQDEDYYDYTLDLSGYLPEED